MSIKFSSTYVDGLWENLRSWFPAKCKGTRFDCDFVNNGCCKNIFNIICTLDIRLRFVWKVVKRYRKLRIKRA